MKSAKETYIELIAQGYIPEQIDDELLCQMMDEEREGLELAAELRNEQLEKGYDNGLSKMLQHDGPRVDE